MDLLYLSVFNEQDVRAMRLLFNTIFKRGNLDTTKIGVLIIIGSEKIIPLVTSAMNDLKIGYDYYFPPLNDINIDHKNAKLRVFEASYVHLYNKILYVDPYTLFNGNITQLFETDILPGKIYSFSHGQISEIKCGAPLFNFDNIEREMSAFSSEIMLFKNHNSIKVLFNVVINRMKNSEHTQLRETYEETPFLIYTAISQKRVDIELLDNLVKPHTDTLEIPEKQVVAYHFTKNTPTDNYRYERMLSFWKKMFSVAFITLTNDGYVDYTLNCLESLRRIDSDITLRPYCIGSKGYTKLTQTGHACTLIDDATEPNICEFQTYKNPQWSKITFCKIPIIHQNLLTHDYVLFTDGDIVYENAEFYNYFIENIGNQHLLIQDEWCSSRTMNELCTGLMFISSSALVNRFFNPETINASNPSWDDQLYVNSLRNKIYIKRLPLDLFPTGEYYYTNHSCINPYVIHFNWLRGHEKKQKMKFMNKWYIDQPPLQSSQIISSLVNIFQENIGVFSGQLEGMLYLVSLSINGKARYVYNYKKEYAFEGEYDMLETIDKYIYYGLQYCKLNTPQFVNSFSQKEISQLNDGSFPTKNGNGRSLEDIRKQDSEYAKYIYIIDGLTSKVNGIFSNVITNDEFVKSLPLLRNAFVTNNPYFQKFMYNHSRINVICYISKNTMLDENMYNEFVNIIHYFQNKKDTHRVIIHSDNDISNIEETNNTVIEYSIDEFNVLCNLINADILLLDLSAVSVVAHLLGNTDQIVLCNDNTNPLYVNRLLRKTRTFHDFMVSAK